MALGRYDINFILRTTDRTGGTFRTVARDMGMMTKQAKLTRAAFTAMDVGRGLQLRGLLGGAALGIAAQQAATFETSVTKAATQIAGNNSLETTAKNTKVLSKEILDLMGQFPASAEMQAAAAYDIFSAMNVPLQKGVGLLKLFNMVSVAGATDLTTASDAMITILNNFGGTWQQTMKSVNTTFAIIRYGKMEFADFNNMLQSVVPAAKGAGQTLEDVAGAMAFLSTRMKPNIAATGLSRLLEVLARPDFRRGADKLGLSIEDMTGKLLPLPQIIDELARLPVAQMESTINSLIPLVTAVGRGTGRGVQATVFSRRALVAMVKDRQAFQNIQKLTVNATSEFEKRYTMMIGSAGVRWEKFKAQLQSVLIMIGTAALPMFERFGKVIGNAVAWAKQNAGMLKFIATAVFWLSIASLISGSFLKIFGASMILGTGLVRLGGYFLYLTKFIKPAIAALKLYAWWYGSIMLLNLKSSASFIAVAGGFAKVSAALRLFVATAMASIVAATAFTTRLAGLGRMLALLVRGGPWIIAITLVWEFRESIWKKTREALGDIAKGMGGAIPLGVGPHGQRVKVSPPDITTDKKKAKDQADKAKEFTVQNYDKMINDIIKDLKSGGKGIFTEKMLKDMGLDPKSLNESMNKLWGDSGAGGGRVDNAKRIATEIANQTKDLLDQAASALVQVYEGFKSANQEAFGSIFEPIEGEGEEAQLRKAWNWTGGSGDLLSTMKARLAQFRKWRGSLNMLLKKGYSKEFVEEFKKMGPEGMKHLGELTKAGPKRVKQFNAVFAAGKGAVTKATEIDFKAQLAKWNRFGKDTALKIILGMESEEQGVQKRMVGMVQRMYAGVAAEIATQAVMLQEAANAAAAGMDLTPFMATAPVTAATPITKGAIAAAGTGKYAIPSAATGGLPVAAVQAMGARYNAMAEYYARQGWTPGKTGGFEPQSVNGGGDVYVFNVNGTFMRDDEMIYAAMKSAKHQTKNKR